ncbi:ADL245Wp [Eremothecium gossypii ATCC 10895]|uniref:protein-tyrosine-phosphatase n=1 Tax=Eremothecium gossypii (strain ATCC 10895 / CBS 109.51 / FGSC 9923 / NRRL Y-1056) TaxID=284811 RepID=Q75B22_EREGS|nr:ADL245Wp [Eremothecium gossypii ATCC 10895]AAS51675.1 ADL245Wp [Eremothecium gossypii ATCC 10895]AEY95972.1 FADL245Wp [Eremothecium gossypii FDAG1]
MSGSLLDLKSRSPKSLQSKNRKKLSLKISNGSPGPKVMMLEPPAEVAGRGDAQIYTLPALAPAPGQRGRGAEDKGGALKLTVETALRPRGEERIRFRPPPMLARGGVPAYLQDCEELGACTPVPADAPLTRSWVFRRGGAAGGCRVENAGCDGADEDDEGTLHSALRYNDVLNGNAYPGEPLCVLVPGLFLYSEPTIEQVLQFDVVVNVAKEITDFTSQIPEGSGTQYYHFKWSHTSKICSNLEELTALIHTALCDGKRVLVHCQCGVSRSASLIVAYIMRYRSMPLNDAYNYLKNVAKDISPNMSLIFQLMEWGEQLKSKDGHSSCSPASCSLSSLASENLSEQPRSCRPRSAVGPKSAFSSPDISSDLSPENTPRTPMEFLNAPSLSQKYPQTAEQSEPSKHDPLQLGSELCMKCSVVLDTFSQPSAEVVDKNW